MGPQHDSDALSADNEVDLGTVLSGLAHEMRQVDISSHKSIAEYQTAADTILQESKDAGVKLTALLPKIDIQRQSMTAGALSEVTYRFATKRVAPRSSSWPRCR